ncbi:MAG: metallophosphoesterase family protein, partial [Pseudomonadota bacterium]
VIGNHEEWVLHCRESPAENPIDAEMRQFTDWAARQLGNSAITMAHWPDHLCFHGPDGCWVHVTHGSMLGNRAGISSSVPDESLAERIPEDIALFIGGHTHKVHRRRYRGVEILNVGSVGSPFDRDERAAYGRLEFRDGRWHIDVRRLAYDRARTDRDFRTSGFLDQGGPLARIIYEEWRRADLLIRYWGQRYATAVQAGEISLAKSVDDFLAGLA